MSAPGYETYVDRKGRVFVQTPSGEQMVGMAELDPTALLRASNVIKKATLGVLKAALFVGCIVGSATVAKTLVGDVLSPVVDAVIPGDAQLPADTLGYPENFAKITDPLADIATNIGTSVANGIREITQ